MQYFRHFLLQCLIFLIFNSNAYSQAIKHFNLQYQPVNSISNVTLSKDPTINKKIFELFNKYSNTTTSTDDFNTIMNKAILHQTEVIDELQHNIASLQLNENHSIAASEELSSIFKNNDKLKNNLNANDDEKHKLNFLDLRLADAFFMLEAVSIAPKLTLELIQHLESLAIDAGNGTHSTDELKNLDIEFQAYKRAINYAQSVTLLNGPKKISGGDVSIKFGSDAAEVSTLTIKIPSFDIESLMLSDLTIQTESDAWIAIGIIFSAESKLKPIINITSLPYIRDAQTMLLSIPFMFYQNFDLVMAANSVIVQALNGINTSDDFELLNIELDFLKSAMTRTQTYLSLSGPKSIGTGKIIIQIGHDSSPVNTLEIDIPTVDIKKIGFDNRNVKTAAAAQEAFDALLKIMYEFSYYPVKSIR